MHFFNFKYNTQNISRNFYSYAPKDYSRRVFKSAVKAECTWNIMKYSKYSSFLIYNFWLTEELSKIFLSTIIHQYILLVYLFHNILKEIRR